MTKSKRIILNTLATYGRSVFAMFAGLFSSRWLLQGLGAQDLGHSCVVGSLIGALVIRSPWRDALSAAVLLAHLPAVLQLPRLTSAGTEILQVPEQKYYKCRNESLTSDVVWLM